MEVAGNGSLSRPIHLWVRFLINKRNYCNVCVTLNFNSSLAIDAVISNASQEPSSGRNSKISDENSIGGDEKPSDDSAQVSPAGSDKPQTKASVGLLVPAGDNSDVTAASSHQASLQALWSAVKFSQGAPNQEVYKFAV